MKHAGQEALDRLEPLLRELRRTEGLTEKRPGGFYWGSKAFCHFHEDPTGLYVDVKLGDEFERLRVQTRAERARFVSQVRESLLSRRGRRQADPFVPLA